MARLICFSYLIFLLASHVKGEGMVEVFRWRQMDYSNRGNNNNNDNVNVNACNWNCNPSTRPSEGNVQKIIFPDQLENYKRRFRRQLPKITSRDDISRTDQNNNANSSYIPYNNVPMGATHFKGRLFITIPRRRPGVPSTLNFIDLRKEGSNPSPKLNAYPNFATNQFDLNNPNPNTLVSVYRTSVDECRRLWFIDTGMLEYPDNRIQLQRPAIWVMDLLTDRVLHRFEIPEEIVETGRGLASITVDVIPFKCQEAFAYIPDLLYNRLYVYSLAQKRIWSFSHNYFNFDPLAGDLNVGGQSFRWNDGIFSITLGPRQLNGTRNAYFHPMASNNEFIVDTEVLKHEENAARSDHGSDFRLLGARGVDKQSTTHEYDPRTGAIFYSEIQQNGVGCWNTKSRFSQENHDMVFREPEKMIYPSDLTIDEEGTMWVMSNSMPIFIYSTLDTNAYNFRVWKQDVFEAVKNTRCAPRY